ncbi:ABC transporter ATP-binding protein [Streptomyces albidoflavus]|uniref:Multidrug ABC transporter ATP-binding protein n=3 Tax=Streptomyces TaxID=1883 RepID=A0AA37BWC4_9ACTN|nr:MULTISPECIES: ABC transporter ATP-binding protein [unclassified Streptomyces]MBK3392226.1 ABC transporter ATP-binding protein [Streptomyces sp. DEF1AK]MBT2893591.1 ABC transporter ATP-binding protein [Streptomyces sp. McG2]MYX53584.1 ATP-binding cassette domain-containing protein [Streptomyces sp. SID8385]RZE58163.1 ABC transporter ATP-binding protein [Streptomyces albidoflavus]MBK3386284.1 ABC transporter ATP-binding protein [Streptomyces sp. DEF147AK]
MGEPEMAFDSGGTGGGGEVVVDVRDLWMRYGEKDVLRGVSFEIRRGEVLGLLGPNGAGKTTTIEIMEGFRQPSSGHVRVLGEDPLHGGDAWRARVGVVLQSWRDHSRWRVGALLEQFASYYRPYAGRDGYPGPYEVAELLARVGLSDKAETRVGALSGGQRRRLDVAVGIVGRPRLLFLDEPTTGFDPKARSDFHDLVHALADLEDTTVLLTTHDLAEAEKLADRILILDGGRIVADGSAEQLARQVAGEDEVRWTRDGVREVHLTPDGTRFTRELFERYGAEITELEVRRASLEDTYLRMVARSEAGLEEPAPDQETVRERTGEPA